MTWETANLPLKRERSILERARSFVDPDFA
jgi:hypothetical protein